MRNTPIRIGSKLRRLREERGLSVIELQKRIHVSRQHIYRIELGQRDASLDLLRKLAEELRVPMTELFEESGKNRKRAS